MLRKTTLLSAALAVAMLGGCVVRGEMSGGAYYDDDAPQLAYVSPGVYVVADYDQPVFYESGYYWLFNDGVWFRSNVYNGGWVRMGYNYVPVRIRRIHRPRAWVHYRARTYYRRGRGGRVIVVRDHRREEVRDHRRNEEVRRPYAGPPGRVRVRDHRRVNVRGRGPARRVQVRDHRTVRRVQERDHRRGHNHKRDHRN